MWIVSIRKKEWATKISDFVTAKIEFKFEKLEEAAAFLQTVVTHSTLKDFDLEFQEKVVE